MRTLVEHLSSPRPSPRGGPGTRPASGPRLHLDQRRDADDEEPIHRSLHIRGRSRDRLHRDGVSGRRGLVIDGSVAVRLWGQLAAGSRTHSFSAIEVVTTVSRVPHPFFFETPREVTGDAERPESERAVHVQDDLPLERSGPVAMSLFGGPSFFDLEQDVVSEIQYDEAFPYDTATFRRARHQLRSAARRSDSTSARMSPGCSRETSA